MSQSLQEQLVSKGLIGQTAPEPATTPTHAMRYAPTFTHEPGRSRVHDDRGPELEKLAAEIVGRRSYASKDDAISAGRQAVCRALEELDLFGIRKTPPRVAVRATPVVVAVADAS